MRIFLKGLNTCAQRNQKVLHYRTFLLANGHELVDDPSSCETAILWTCAFRTDVHDNSISQVNHYEQEYSANLIVAGCLPDIAPTSLEKHFGEKFKGEVVPWRDDVEMMEKKFRIPGGPGLNDIEAILTKEPLCEDAAVYRKENPNKDVTFYDQFIQLVVAEGCPFKCTYCSERLAFPEFHSFSENALVQACKEMVEKTQKYDVILVADCVGEYGRDSDTNLPKLVRKLLAIDPRIRVALNNFHPQNFITHFDDLIALVKEGRIRHLNLPIQSASDRILKLMNRQYTRAEAEKIYSTLQKEGFKEFDTHILVGFPGETEEDVDLTLDFIIRYKPKHVLLSRYLECDDAPSVSLKNKVDWDISTERAKRMEEAILNAGILCNSDVGEMMKTRFEKLNSVCPIQFQC